MTKKAFTLAELLGVIIIIGVLALLITPIVDKSLKNSETKVYEAQIKKIENAANDWAMEHMNMLPKNDQDYIIVYLWQLKVGGYIDSDIRDPRTGKLFPNDMEIKITREYSNYVFEVIEGSGTEGNTEIPDRDKPIITLHGDSVINININSEYTELGAIAVSGDGTDLTDDIVIAGTVDTSKEGTYYITYNVMYNGEAAEEVVRTVNVMDKNPVITLSPNGTTGYSKALTVDVIATPTGTHTIRSFTYKINGGDTQNVVENKINLNFDGTYVIEVTAIDDAGHTTTITSNPYYIDTTAPTITFDEEHSAIVLKVDEVAGFDLTSGVTVTDNNDTIDINDAVISGTLDETLGEHVITYTVTDEAGNTATKERIIIVVDEDAVARIGSTTYSTLRNAIDAVTTTDQTTIVLLKDISLTEEEAVSSTQNIILDLDGYNIDAASNNCAFNVSGTLIFDSANGGSINHQSDSRVAIVNNGNLEVRNGTFSSTSNVIRNNSEGMLTISGGEFSSTDYATIYNYGGTLNMNGGNLLSSAASGIYNENNGNVTISGSNVEISTYGDVIYNNVGTVLVENGVLESTNGSGVQNDSGTVTIQGNALLSSKSSNTVNNYDELIINGGTITSESTDTNNYPVIYNQVDGNILITNGTFESVYSSHMISLGDVTIDNGSFIGTSVSDYMFRNRGNGDFVINGGNFTGNTRILNGVSGDTTVTGDLNINGGYFQFYSDTNAIQNFSSGNVTLKNTKIETFDEAEVSYPIIYNYAAGNVTIEDGTNIVSNTRTHIYNKGTGEVTINGGVFENELSEMVANVSSGTITVNGGTFNSASDILWNEKSGTIYVKGGNFYATGGDVIVNGALGDGYEDQIGTVEVTGGTYHLENAGLLYNAVNGNVTVSNIQYDETSLDGANASYIFYNNDSSSYTGSMTVNNSTIKTNNARIYQQRGNGNLTINGGEYEVNNSGFLTNSSEGNVEINSDIHVVSNTPQTYYSDEDEYRWTAFITNGQLASGGGIVTINGGTYESTTTGFASNRNNGTLVINDATVILNIDETYKTNNRTQMFSCIGSSTTIINGGHFENYYGSLFVLDDEDSMGFVATENTSVIIGDGTKDISTTNPKIVTKDTYYIISHNIGSVTFNNGILVGKYFFSDESNVTYRSEATLSNGTETIDGVTYNTLYFK